MSCISLFLSAYLRPWLLHIPALCFLLPLPQVPLQAFGSSRDPVSAALCLLYVQFSSVAQLCRTLCDHMDCSMLGFPVHHQLPELAQTMSTESVMSSKHFILCRPLLLPPSVFPSIKVFSSESVLCIRWPKYQSFISPSNEYAGLISFRIDWFDFLAVQRILKSLLQDYSSKASVRSSVLSRLHGPTLTSIHSYWKNHSLD